MNQVLEWIALAFMLVITSGVTLWMAGAIYFDVCHACRWSTLGALVWVAVVAAVFALWEPTWKPFATLIGVLLLFHIWWRTLKPRHDRVWEPAVAVLPRAICTEDSVMIENIRNFEYRSLDEFTPRYETRTYNLSNLRGVDIILFNWGSALMSHPVLVFDFGPDCRVCFSIEVRYRRGQSFSIARSLYRQQELIFVAADERDIILRRTKYGKPQAAHLYHLNVTCEEARVAFLDYVAAINDLYTSPRWYHGVSANCTTTFYRLPGSRIRYDWRVLVNAKLDKALYDDGRLDRTLPFPELRRIAYLTDVANSGPEVGFGDYIRHELGNRRHER